MTTRGSNIIFHTETFPKAFSAVASSPMDFLSGSLNIKPVRTATINANVPAP